MADDKELDEKILQLTLSELQERTQWLDNEIRIMRNEIQQINDNIITLKEKTEENQDRINVKKKKDLKK